MKSGAPIHAQRRRMAMVVHSFYPHDVRVRREALAMLDAGWDVDIICLREPGEAAREDVQGISVIRLPLGRSRGSRARYAVEYALFWWLAGWTLFRHARARRYLVVQVHTLPDFLVFATAGAKLAGARILLDLHEVAPEFYQQKFGSSPEAMPVRILSRIEQASIRYADHAITVNEPVRERFLKRGADPTKLGIVMNSADERIFPPESSCYCREQSPPDRFSLVYHGSLLPIYGVDLAIRAVAELRARWPFQLHLFGSGEAAASLERLAHDLDVADAVHFLGRVPQTQIAGHLQDIAGGIVPTRPGPMLDLSLSNKLLEMACLGLPIISARLPSYEQIFPEGTVHYFTPGDLSGLTAAMDRFATTSDAQRRELVRAAFDAYAPWRWQPQREEYVRVVEALAERNGRRATASPQDAERGDR